MGHDPCGPLLVGLSRASWTSSHHDVWIPRGRVPWGNIWHHYILSVEVGVIFTEFCWFQWSQRPTCFKTRESTLHLVIGEWRFEEFLVERYCCSHLCKIQFAPLTSFLKSLSKSIYFSHCSQKEFWSYHSLVQQQGRVFSALHLTKSGLFCVAPNRGVKMHIIIHSEVWNFHFYDQNLGKVDQKY